MRTLEVQYHNPIPAYMKELFIFVFFATMALASCGSHGTQKQENSAANSLSADTVQVIAITGQWYIKNVVESDSLHTRPSDITPDVRQYITFNEDGTLDIKTNCNMMSGRYDIEGDSLTVSRLAWTEMACENMKVEQLLQRMLPRVCAYEMESDSILRLVTVTPGEYVVLRKATEKK